MGVLWAGSYAPSTCPQHSLNISLLAHFFFFFQTHCVLSLFQTWNQPFLRGALVLFGGEWCVEIMIWAPGCSLLLGCRSMWGLSAYLAGASVSPSVQGDTSTPTSETVWGLKEPVPEMYLEQRLPSPRMMLYKCVTGRQEIHQMC